jgi:hypothetical protein
MPKILFLVLSIATVCYGEISFKKENIAVRIFDCDTLEIVADYYFSNTDTTDASTMIYYPFPIDSIDFYPHYIIVSYLKDGKSVKYIQKDDGITWNLKVNRQSIDSIRVVYHQRVSERRGRYILTTTKYWKKPLEQADFSVSVPEHMTLTYWSFQFDSVNMQNGTAIYRARKSTFLPDTDMMLEWSCNMDNDKE